MTGNIEMSEKSKEASPVRIDEAKCKSCVRCVRFCPRGVLSMKPNDSSLYGETVSVDHPESCTGCGWCWNSCPELVKPIYVLGRKEYKYPKFTPEEVKEAEDRQAEILQTLHEEEEAE